MQFMPFQDDLKRQALKLPGNREQFVDSSGRDDDEETDELKIEAAILDEVMWRYQEVVDGKIELLSGEEVFEELRAELD
jgi:hypothetical protein